ncbi:alanine/glycine:cation symporter family protein [Limibacter armeniacum]|uniref:alanine/glycine:cation symporter family protein n=1 Tax=Limibacter armeniacum TaxID=466084 RepID=UPI002FE589AF
MDTIFLINTVKQTDFEMHKIEELVAGYSDLMWGMPLLVLLLGGGLFFFIYSSFLPLKAFKHAIDVLRGAYDDPEAEGQISHFGALASSMAATVGMGNISGVALAIMAGGPGALFWMWVSALLGMGTKFFTCTLSVMYRKVHKDGKLEGGPMYIITQGLGEKWKPLAGLFAVAGLIGTLPMFESNQVTQVVREMVLEPNGIATENPVVLKLILGIGVAILVGVVIFGGLQRIVTVAERMVPAMVVLYMLCVGYIILVDFDQVPASFALIFSDAFSGNAVLGGALGSIIVIGAKRAAFSNEAGIGTAPMMHGDAKNHEPVQEGLVAMLGPAIDTILVCTLTALAIIITGVWKGSDAQGVTLTAQAFESAMPTVGTYLLVLCVAIFSFTTLFTFSHYGSKCWGFLFGEETKHWYNYIYIATIILGSVFTVDVVINLIDGCYATMAVPTMLSTLLLAPRVRKATKHYLSRLKSGEIKRFDQQEKKKEVMA